MLDYVGSSFGQRHDCDSLRSRLSATYSRHVSILWELDIAIPGTLLQRYASLAA